jgi:membrane-anchored mycosin MYCP
VAAAVLGALGAPAGAAGGVPGGDCTQFRTGMPSQRADDVSAPLDLLGIRRAQQLLEDRGIRPGEAANVAVLDSGVYDGPALPVREHRSFTGRSDLVYYHGTAVAGVIAGRPRPGGKPVGVAPDAEVVDVRVYDTGDETTTDPTELRVAPGRLAEGLEWVAANARRLRIKVANVSLATSPDRRLRVAVEKVWRSGVVVVASSGNRPEQGQVGYEQFGARKTGEDAAGAFFPAAYPHVVAVNATAEPVAADASEAVLASSDTDVAAPTPRLVSVAVNGSYCVLNQVATSWSAALVSGVVSLLASAYPDDTPAQLVARLLETANGTAGTPTKLTGYGVVQPVEALTRPLSPRDDGSLDRAVVEHDAVRAAPPEPADDLLAETREDSVWWALLGGGLLVVALLLRPVLARCRR